jgi:hypothetical protein
LDCVVAVGAGDDHRVGLAIAGGPADRAGEADSDRNYVGPGQIVDSDAVGAAEGIDADALDVVEVHDDIAEVAGEQGAPTVGRDREGLIPGAAVEEQGVGAVPALDRVAAVARIPLEYVVAGAEEGTVAALLAVGEIVVVAAEQKVGAVAAENGVVAGPAVHRHAKIQASQIARGAEGVVAAVHVEDEVFGRADVDAERRGIDPIEAHAQTIGGDGEHLGAVIAVDLGGVDAVAAFG